MQKVITSNKLDLGFFSVPNLVSWLIFNVNIIGVRAWIVTDQSCWIGIYFSRLILQTYGYEYACKWVGASCDDVS